MSERTRRLLVATTFVLLVVSTAAAGLTGPAVLLAALGGLVAVWRARVPRRLAVRNALRRPRESALVVLGSMLGTAIITGSFIVGDTLDSSITRTAFTQLGPVDEVVRVPELADLAEVDRLLTGLAPEVVDGTLPVVRLGAAVIAGDERAEPHATLLEVDVARAATFGSDPGLTGFAQVTQPAAGEAVIGADLARILAVDEGATVTAHAYGQAVPLRIVGTMPRLGVAGFTLSFGSTSPNLLVAPGTIAGLAAGRGPGAAPPIAGVAVSNRGGVLDGADLTARARAEIEARLGERPSTIVETKRDRLEQAELIGEQFTQLFSSIGAFSVLAGTLLLVNIFVMLAQERKTELGMLRAVGLRRSSLVASFTFEGWMYAVASSALGTIAGLGVGRVIVAVAAGIFGAGGNDFGLELRYDADPASIVGGFVTGFLISFVTVAITAIAISRLNVIRAIRDLPEPDADRPGARTMVAGALAVVAGLGMFRAGLASDAGIPVLLGPGLVALGIVPLLRRFLPARALVSVAAVAVLAWATAAFDVLADAFRDDDISVFVVQGVMLTAAAVALVSQNQDLISAVVRRAGGGSRSMALRLGLAYPLARRFRTAMTLTMYALVVFTLTFITTFSHLFGGQIDDFTRQIAGGFDLRMFSNSGNPAPVAAVQAVDGVDLVAPVTSVAAEFTTDRKPNFVGWSVGTFDEALVRHGAPSLADRGRYRTDTEAYRAVLRDPSLFLPSEFFLEEGGGGPPAPPLEPGDEVTMRNPVTGATRRLTVAAVARAGFGNSLPLVSPTTLSEVFGDRPSTDSLYIATEPGTDAVELATRLNAEFLENGADAASFREIVDENLSQQQQFFRLMQGYLALGLVVGIAGLGVVMVRAVRERRRQVGVLRALGFPSAAIRRAFVAESAFVALEGTLIGMALAIVTAWRLVGSDAFGESLAFSVPWVSLLVLLAATFVASLAATAAPAQQASRIRPAVALRLTD